LTALAKIRIQDTAELPQNDLQVKEKDPEVSWVYEDHTGLSGMRKRVEAKGWRIRCRDEEVAVLEEIVLIGNREPSGG
jgi:hypothetical protein